ncbi:MAG: hypothetical protein N4A44_02530 [Alphaproteobacteria bacterium]|jgi:type IV secretion system protein VirB4|nr:hypothetical protein [Alphaproteobacteria bacterium]
MEFAVIDKFILTDIAPINYIFGALGVLGLAILAIFSLFKIKGSFLRRGFDTKLAEFIPFSEILSDGKTVECSNKTLVRVFKMEGVSSFFYKKNLKNNLFEAKQNWLDSFDNKDISCRIITIREKQKRNVNSKFENSILQKINDIWSKNIEDIYINTHYVVVSYEGSSLEKLDEICYSFKAYLDNFGMKELSITDFPEDNPLTPFIKVLNPVSKPNIDMKGVSDDIADAITSEEVFFSNEGNIRFRYGTEEKYLAVIGIKNISNVADEDMIDKILSLNFELNILDTFSVVSSEKAKNLLLHQKNAVSSNSYSYDTGAQFDEALSQLDEYDEEHQSLFKFSQTFSVYASTEEELNENVFEIVKILRSYGVVPVREGVIAQASWFLNFPSYDIAPRVYNVMSRPISCLIDFEKQPSGFDRSDWGDGSITNFLTAQGTSYQFQFHVSPNDGAVGHTVTIGPTGQGKTTLYAFLASQAMKNNKLRTFFFDRYRGVEIFSNAINGDYINFNLGSKFLNKVDQKSKGDDVLTNTLFSKEVALNPFKIKDTPENRSFLKVWLRELALATDSKSEEEIARAITTNFDYLEYEDRNLKNLYNSCFSANGYMKKELKRWVEDNEYGEVFNAENDSMSLNSKWTAFDFTYILDDEVLAPAVVSYVMNRIQNVTARTGDPSLIIIDETAPLLANSLFRKNFAIGLQEGRKKRQVYLAAFQQPSVIDKLGMGEVIRGQAQTEIFFRNPMATEVDYKNWKLTPKEFAFIQGKIYKDLPYAILLRKPSINESVILNVDLSFLGNYLQLFNSGRKNVILAEELKKTYNDEWVNMYLKSTKK